MSLEYQYIRLLVTTTSQDNVVYTLTQKYESLPPRFPRPMDAKEAAIFLSKLVRLVRHLRRTDGRTTATTGQDGKRAPLSVAV